MINKEKVKCRCGACTGTMEMQTINGVFQSTWEIKGVFFLKLYPTPGTVPYCVSCGGWIVSQ